MRTQFAFCYVLLGFGTGIFYLLYPSVLQQITIAPCQWSNPEEYRPISLYSTEDLKYYHNITKHNKLS